MTTQDVERALRHVFDPELGIDIVSLGLVYAIEVEGEDIRVKMTTTSPRCPMGEALVGMVESVLGYGPSDGTASVELVFDPPWDVRMADERALRHLGLVPREGRAAPRYP
ncbi:MAG: SUF system Fe-S cluster assembly protein [Dehalococcoidia bacterium]